MHVFGLVIIRNKSYLRVIFRACVDLDEHHALVEVLLLLSLCVQDCLWIDNGVAQRKH
jgi:hypothetical protein